MQNKNKKKQKEKKASTQNYLPIAEIKEGVVVLKDGTMRAIVMTSSINFALKSEDEQVSMISSYVNFLNSLDFPIQILVQSRRLQIQPYLKKLINLEREQKNELLRNQTVVYRKFIEKLIDIGKIMTKKYYVVVPYNPLSDDKKSFWSRLKEVLKPAISLRLKQEKFQKRKEGLDTRIRQVENGLRNMGLQTAQLDTQSLIELYYNSYNPDISFAEEIGDINTQSIEED